MLSLASVLIAPAVGSFIGLVVARSGSGRSLVFGGSCCDHCGRRLPARDLVPLFSWALSGGRSRCCRQPITALYPLVELAALAVALWAVAVTTGPIAIASLALGWTLLALSLIDLRSYRLPDGGTLPLILAGLALSAIGQTGPLWLHLLGAAVGYAALAGIGAVYERLRGEPGLGLGDAKLLAAAGAWLGLQALPSVMLIACLSALAMAAVLARLRGELGWRSAIPFGPALAVGFWITWLYGPLLLG